MKRKSAAPDILIIRVNSVPLAKRKNFVERTVRIHLLTNAAYALSARFTVLILQKIFALLKRSHPMFVMDAVSSQNVRC